MTYVVFLYNHRSKKERVIARVGTKATVSCTISNSVEENRFKIDRDSVILIFSHEEVSVLY